MELNVNVPYGNAADVGITNAPPESVVEFTPSPGGGTETMWFCFRLRQADPRCSRVRIVLKNFGNVLGGGVAENCQPVIRYEGGDWQRMERGVTERLADGRVNAVWNIDAPETYADVAWCYPYGRPELETLLADTKGYWTCDTIGVSQLNRPLYRISNTCGTEGSGKPGLYLISRQHASETSGGWVLDGFLRHIATVGESAPMVWAVPMSNIDDLEAGHYGKDPHPIDVNRAWGNPPMRHENHVIQHDIQRWSKRCKASLTIDFHSPGACETGGIYVFSPPPEDFAEYNAAIVEWAKPISKHLGEYALQPDMVRIARYPSRWNNPTFSKYAWATFGICGLTFETPYSLIRDLTLTREIYQEIGSRIAAAVLGRLTT